MILTLVMSISIKDKLAKSKSKKNQFIFPNTGNPYAGIGPYNWVYQHAPQAPKCTSEKSVWNEYTNGRTDFYWKCAKNCEELGGEVKPWPIQGKNSERNR